MSAPKALDRLDERLGLLDRIIEVGDGRLDDAVVARAAAASTAARDRLGHGTAHTVVALAGATGSGKSSMFNAISGNALARTGVTRPTTSTAEAVVFGEGADRLLDWLKIPRRHVATNPELDGLVLLDLPDHDSTAEAHRAEVDRLVEVVDVFLWVLDPQKYADAALHDGYLRRFAHHGAVTLVALNQIDRLDAAERSACVDHLRHLLGDDGLTGARILQTSTTTGEGIDAVRRELTARVNERRALVSRLSADLDWLGDDLLAAAGDSTPGRLTDADLEGLRRSLYAAAGGDALAQAVGHAHLHRAHQALGWPPIRWLARFRPDPLKRLGLQRSSSRPLDTVTPDVVARTSRSGPGAVETAAVASSVEHLARTATEGVPDPLRRRVVGAATGRLSTINDELDQAVASTPLPTGRPLWWNVINIVQWVVAGVMAVGLLWLTLIFVLQWLGLPKLPTWNATDRVSWPTVLAVGGAALGLVIAALGRLAAGVGAKRRRRKAAAELRRRTDAVAKASVEDPLRIELAAVAELGELTRGFHR